MFGLFSWPGETKMCSFVLHDDGIGYSVVNEMCSSVHAMFSWVKMCSSIFLTVIMLLFVSSNALVTGQ
jgi:hypothetical protein